MLGALSQAAGAGAGYDTGTLIRGICGLSIGRAVAALVLGDQSVRV